MEVPERCREEAAELELREEAVDWARERARCWFGPEEGPGPPPWGIGGIGG
jgi:hypothetical protein